MAKGKNAWRISDRSGFRIKWSRAIRDWNGSWVDPSEYDGEPPSLRPKPPRPDGKALPHARGEPTSSAIDQQLYEYLSNASQANRAQTFGPTG